MAGSESLYHKLMDILANHEDLSDGHLLQTQWLYLPLRVPQPVIWLCIVVTCSQGCSSTHHVEYHCADARGQIQFVLLIVLWHCCQTVWECCQPTVQKTKGNTNSVYLVKTNTK